jgi:hypothetical protein
VTGPRAVRAGDPDGPDLPALVLDRCKPKRSGEATPDAVWGCQFLQYWRQTLSLLHLKLWHADLEPTLVSDTRKSVRGGHVATHCCQWSWGKLGDARAVRGHVATTTWAQ